MVNVATEMQRQGFTLPLLIGGATTSRAHTAVKVDPRYDGPVVWVKDASRSVPVTAALLHETNRVKLMADVKADYDSLRARHAAKNDRPVGHPRGRPGGAHPDRVAGLPAAAAAPAPAAGPRRLADHRPPGRDPARAGRPERRPRRHPPLHRLAAVLQRVGDEGVVPGDPRRRRRPARPRGSSTTTRRQMMERLIDERWLTANGVVGLFPANSVGDDIEVYLDEQRGEAARRTPPPAAAGRTPARRTEPMPGRLRRAQGDRSQGLRRDVRGDGRARQPRADRAVQGGDRRLLRDPARVAGRPAGRGVRRADARARARELWGYAARRAPRQRGSCSRSSTPASGPRRGTPRAPTTPRSRCCGTCSTSSTNTGMELTESMAMWPGASVSGHLLQPPRVAVLRRRPARPRPGRRLRRAQGLDAGRGRALALAQPRLRPGGLTR